MANTCSSCRYWWNPDPEQRKYGVCNRITLTSKEAYTEDVSANCEFDKEVGFNTTSDFGCTLFEDHDVVVWLRGEFRRLLDEMVDGAYEYRYEPTIPSHSAFTWLRGEVVPVKTKAGAEDTLKRLIRKLDEDNKNNTEDIIQTFIAGPGHHFEQSVNDPEVWSVVPDVDTSEKFLNLRAGDEFTMKFDLTPESKKILADGKEFWDNYGKSIWGQPKEDDETDRD